MARQRRRRNGSNTTRTNSGADCGFEVTLWATADTMRGHMDALEYKHVVLGLIFLIYMSDAFRGKHAKAIPSNLKELGYGS